MEFAAAKRVHICNVTTRAQLLMELPQQTTSAYLQHNKTTSAYMQQTNECISATKQRVHNSFSGVAAAQQQVHICRYS
jgi:DNA polymerase I-like protein with 3'-5' exonuclease and polymerase domains